MPRFCFSYRGGEILAAVTADTEEQALEAIRRDSPDVEWEVQSHFLHGDMWERDEDSEQELVPPPPYEAQMLGTCRCCGESDILFGDRGFCKRCLETPPDKLQRHGGY